MRLLEKLRAQFYHPDTKLIFTMYFTVLVEQLLAISTGTVHSIMISNLGKQAISAVGLVDNINGLFVTLALSLGTGTTVLVAQHIGAHDEKKAKKFASQALLGGTIITLFTGGFLFLFGDKVFNAMYRDTEKAVFDYAMVYMKASVSTFPTYAIYSITAGILRASGDMKRPMRISFLSGVINVAASAVFIYVFDLGTLGAGLGLVVSRIYSSGMAIYVLIKDKWVDNARDLLIFNFSYFSRIFKISFFVGLESLLFSMGKILTNSYIVAAGTDHIAANSIAGALINLYLAFGNAFSVVATTLVGRYIGAENKKDAFEILSKITKFASLLLALICIGTIPIQPFFIRLYTDDATVTELVRKILLMASFATPTVWVLAALYPSGFRGAGDIMFSSINTISCLWLVRITLAFVLTKFFAMGVIGVWISQYIEWTVRGSISYLRFRSKKWLNKKLVES